MLDEESNLNSEALLSELFAHELPLTDEDRLELWRRRREASQYRPGEFIQIRSTDLEDGPGILVGLIWMLCGIASWEILRWGWQFIRPLLFTVLAVTAPDLIGALQADPGGC